MSIPDIPDYNANYPPMDGNWVSDTNFDLGWIASLHNLANKTISKIYGHYDEFSLNEDDLLNFDELDASTFADNSGPIIYISIWSLVFVILLIWSLCWCCVNKCCCCCRSSFKGRNAKGVDDFDNNQLRPYYSERNEKKFGNSSVGAIILTIFMAIWLIGLLIIILHAFASNDKTKDGIDRIQPDLDSTIGDVNEYIGITVKQLRYLFTDAFDELRKKVMFIADDWTCPPSTPDCEENIKKPFLAQVGDAVAKTGEFLDNTSKDLGDAITTLQTEMNEVKDELDENYADIIKDVNDGLHWFFMVFNVIYCIIFGLVLIGTVLATFGRSNGLKTTGYLLIRGAIVVIFIAAIFAVFELIIMFVVAGVSSRIICPVIRDLEIETSPSTSELPFNIKTLINATGVFKVRQDEGSDGGYKVPNVGQILRSCKNDKSAYEAFNLETAYNINDLTEVEKYFEITPPINDPLVDKVVEDIRFQVKEYIKFVQTSTNTKLGQCEPAYKAINATVSLFCDKMTAPIASFWWILQFVPLTFILIAITAMFFERFHF